MASGAPRTTASANDIAQLFPNGLRVLVVDDDPLCVIIMEKMLRRCNYIGAQSWSARTPHRAAAPYCAAAPPEGATRCPRRRWGRDSPSAPRAAAVTSCNRGSDALRMLRESTEPFDLVRRPAAGGQRPRRSQPPLLKRPATPLAAVAAPPAAARVAPNPSTRHERRPPHRPLHHTLAFPA